MNVAGGDVLFLGLGGFVYFAIIFLIEYLSKIGDVLKFFTREHTVPYVDKEYDTDVAREMQEVENA